METKDFKKNYTDRIIKKIIPDSGIENKEEIPNDINNMIILLNYCFWKRNNFFVENFNVHKIKNVCELYNRIKTNILTATIGDIFFELNYHNLKILRYIITNSINNYVIIENNNEELCSIISRDSLKRILVIINNALILKSQEK